MKKRVFTRQAALSWLSVGLLGAACCALALLQYRWTGEISQAEEERLRHGLAASLDRLSREFNTELSAAAGAILASATPDDAATREAAYAERFREWRESARHPGLFRAVALAIPAGDDVTLLRLDFGSSAFSPAPWPDSWISVRDRLRARLQRSPTPPFEAGTLIELPRMERRPENRPGGRDRDPRRDPRGFFTEREWLLLDVDPVYAAKTVLPDLLQRHLGVGGRLDYDAQVASRHDRQILLPAAGPLRDPDAAVGLFEIQLGELFRRPGSRGPGFGGGPPRDPNRGRWILSVRHRAGSLDALVNRTRRRNLGVSAGLIALLLATVFALVTASRRAQQLAELQMQFVANVSHELRTPLTVIRTAAYNLKGRLAGNPTQVARYGAVIEQESERLGTLVEQVLRFARSRAGHVIGDRSVTSVESFLDRGIGVVKPTADRCQCVIERTVDPALPPVLADEMALTQVVQNLIENAVKYGSEGGGWIGVSARPLSTESGEAVEIRVADRGPGIPPDEQRRIFDPFFRGRRAVQDQIHGTGLGLNLVKKIVEAHGGRIRVESAPPSGAEFVVILPAAPHEMRNEFANPVS